MKHVKLFEQFINESELKDLLSQYAEELKAEGYDAKSSNSQLTIKGIEPKFDKRFKGIIWEFYYSPDYIDDLYAYGMIDGSKYDIPDYSENTRFVKGRLKGFKIKSAKDIIKGLKSFNKWDVNFNWIEWRFYWFTVEDHKTNYRQTKRGDLTNQDIKDAQDFYPEMFKNMKLTKHPVLGFNIITLDDKYHWDGKDLWYGKIEGGKDWKYGSIECIEVLFRTVYPPYNFTPADNKRAWESNRHSIDRTVDYVETSDETYHSRKR